MFQRILRERRRNRWKSRRKWQKAQRKIRREEQELRKSREYAKPDRWLNVQGVVIGVHILRNRFRSPVEFRFEFHRKDGANKQLATDFGEQDLDVLLKAITVATRYREFHRRKRASKRNGNVGVVEAKPSKVKSLPKVSQGNRI
jgi:hypothetical protein